MRIQKLKNFKLKDFVLISSLPDMGRVGGLVSDHISKNLETELAGKITIMDKPWVNQKNRIIDNPKDEYSVFVDEKNSVVVFTGDNQPQEATTVLDLSKNVISMVQEFGEIKLVISSGGYMPQNQEIQDNVYGIATDRKTSDILKRNGIKTLDSQVNSITWFNGLILGKAKKLGIPGIGLFGEISESNTPQYKAAVNVIRKIQEITGIKINTSGLSKKIIKKPEEKKTHSPGIG